MRRWLARAGTGPADVDDVSSHKNWYLAEDLRDEAVKRVFVDTSAFFAHLVAEDRHHLQAMSASIWAPLRTLFCCCKRCAG